MHTRRRERCNREKQARSAPNGMCRGEALFVGPVERFHVAHSGIARLSRRVIRLNGAESANDRAEDEADSGVLCCRRSPRKSSLKTLQSSRALRLSWLSQRFLTSSSARSSLFVRQSTKKSPFRDVFFCFLEKMRARLN